MLWNSGMEFFGYHNFVIISQYLASHNQDSNMMMMVQSQAEKPGNKNENIFDWIKSNIKILDDCTEKWLIDFWLIIEIDFEPLFSAEWKHTRNSFVIAVDVDVATVE